MAGKASATAPQEHRLSPEEFKLLLNRYWMGLASCGCNKCKSRFAEEVKFLQESIADLKPHWMGRLSGGTGKEGGPAKGVAENGLLFALSGSYPEPTERGRLDTTPQCDACNEALKL